MSSSLKLCQVFALISKLEQSKMFHRLIEKSQSVSVRVPKKLELHKVKIKMSD